jgi:hypothetical protein
MSCSRRDFLKDSMGAAFVSALPASAFTLLTTEEAKADTIRCARDPDLGGALCRYKGRSDAR